MKKRILLLAMTFVMAFASSGILAGCGKTVNPPLGDNEHATIKMWGGGTQWQGEYLMALEAFINDFNDGLFGQAADDINITVEFEVQESIETMMSTSVGDIEYCPNIMIWDRFSTPTYAYQDYLQPIDSYITDIDTSKFHSEAYKELGFYSVADPGVRHQYGLPLDVDPWGVYVNMDIVTKHNTAVGTSSEFYVDPARLNDTWTWWDLLDIAKRLTGTKTGSQVFGYSSQDLQQHFFKFFTSTGQEFIIDDTSALGGLSANINNLQGHDVLSFFKSLKTANVGKGQVDDIDFVSGSIAMVNQATYYGKYIGKYKNQPNTVQEYRFLPQPRYSGFTEGDHAVKAGAVNAGMIGGFGLAIPKLTDKLLKKSDVSDYYYSYVNRTMKFMEWWAYGEGAKYWAMYTETLPALTELYSDDDVMVTEVQKSAKNYVENYKIRNNVRGFQDFQKSGINAAVENFVNNTGDSQTNRQAVLNDIISKSKTYLKK